MFTCIVPARMIPIDAALLLQNSLNIKKVTWTSVKSTYTVRISPKNWMLSPVWRMERAACADESRQDDAAVPWKAEVLTLENMWVIGLVTLILSNPAMQSKNPNMPVTRLPEKKTPQSQVLVWANWNSFDGSWKRRTKGRIKIADPTFVHQANSIVELLQ